MRKISIGRAADGHLRMMLNNHALFEFGTLDQGWWPGGLYTPPSDAAIRNDMLTIKQLGFNMMRKHVKVEPARWYYDADSLGLLIWQDMPSGDNKTAASRTDFLEELHHMIDALRMHPSIVMWVPFNEGWGQHDTEQIVAWLKGYDPSRLVDNASGWTDHHVGDVSDIHVYPGPGIPAPDSTRARVLGEFGGLGLPLEGHTWLAKNNWGYRTYTTRAELDTAYPDLLGQLRWLIADGLSAAVYTQTTDVENEVNGLMTYDRAVVKPMPDARAAAMALFGPPPRARVVVASSQDAPQTWQYTTVQPAADWFKPGFDAAGVADRTGRLRSRQPAGRGGAHRLAHRRHLAPPIVRPLGRRPTTSGVAGAPRRGRRGVSQRHVGGDVQGLYYRICPSPRRRRGPGRAAIGTQPARCACAPDKGRPVHRCRPRRGDPTMKTQRTLVLGVVVAIATVGCGGKPAARNAGGTMPDSASISSAPFGVAPSGDSVTLYTLTNPHGMRITVMTYGGIITSIDVPDRDGKMGDVVLGYDSLAGYVRNSPYFGAIVGRYANRIAKGRFTLDGKTYHLAINNGQNALHGGLVGFDKVVWHAEPFQHDSNVGLVLTHTSPDGDQGYPGTLQVTVTYTLRPDNALQVDYDATTDKATILNLTQHSYFNLAGAGNGDILGEMLTINADRYTPVDSTLIPTGELAPVAGTPLDFRTPTMIGAGIGQDNAQLKYAGGYDHNFVLNRGSDSTGLVHAVHWSTRRRGGCSTSRPRSRGCSSTPATSSTAPSPARAARSMSTAARWPGDAAFSRFAEPPELPVHRAAPGREVPRGDGVCVRRAAEVVMGAFPALN